MALIVCAECGGEVSDQARACPKCNAPVPRSRTWLWGLAAVAGLGLLFVMAAGNSPEAKAKAQARGVIDQCWKDQQRKSLDPGTSRFVAAMCENMERQFTQRYGHRP